ncbi:MAG: RDD family protein [Candidatus Margulisiibacteriota bacterium]
MRISYKTSQRIVVVIICLIAVGAFLLARSEFDIATEGEAFFGLFMALFLIFLVLASPVFFWLKSRLHEFAGMPLSKVVFAIPEGQFPGKLRGSWLSIFKEEKDPLAATALQRVAAYLVDLSLLLLAGLVATLLSLLFVILLAVFNVGELPAFTETFIFISFAVCLGSVIVYLFIRDGFNGQGIGKRLIKIQVIDKDSRKPIGFGKSALRYLILRVLSIIEFILLLVTPNHRRLGDLVANTIVVKKP